VIVFGLVVIVWIKYLDSLIISVSLILKGMFLKYRSISVCESQLYSIMHCIVFEEKGVN